MAVAGTVLTISQYLVEAQADWALEGMLLGNYVEASFGEWPRVGWEQGYLVHVQSAAPVEEHWELSMTSSWAEAAEVTVNKGAATPVFCEVGAVGPDVPDAELAENTTTAPTTADEAPSTTAGPTAPGPGSAESDRAALVTFHHATNGQQWKDIGNWLSDAPLHQWYGVETDTTGRVIHVSLPDNWLAGEIPPELGQLTKLRQLNLRGELLKGEIPAELGYLSNLESLSLSGEQLSGGIPSELGRLTNLESLVLSQSQLNGEIPSELGGLVNLKSLDLSQNQLTGELPAELANLGSLESLNLSENQLTGEIPAELGKLRLSELWLGGNQFEGCLPTWLGVVRKGHGRVLPLCEVVAPPSSSVGDAEREALRSIYQEGIGLNVGSWPSDGPLGSWAGVFTNSDGRVVALDFAVVGKWLFINRTRDQGGSVWFSSGRISEHLKRLTNLESLSLALSGPLQSGVLPSGLDNLTSLRELMVVTQGNERYVRSNKFDTPTERPGTGPSYIPAELGYLDSLESLTLTGALFDGEIPVELGNLAGLKRLQLDAGMLIGEIPAELGNLTNLEVLTLSGNFSGEIPAELGNLRNLRELNLRGTELTGEIPRELANLTNLGKLTLSGNELTGCLPKSFDWLPMSDFQAIGLPFCSP